MKQKTSAVYTAAFNTENTTLDTTTRNTKGAVVYTTTNNPLLDLFSHNVRFDYKNDVNETKNYLQTTFSEAWNYSEAWTLAYLLYTADIENGLGERSATISYLQTLQDCNQDALSKLLPLVVNFMGWRVLFLDYDQWNVTTKQEIARLVWKNAISKDCDNLMFKWLPSVSGAKAKAAAGLIKTLNAYFDKEGIKLHFNQATYRKWLSQHRKTLNLLESNLSQKTYNKIDLNKLPSRVLRLHTNWFKENLTAAWEKYIESLKTNTKAVKTVSVVESFHDWAHAGDANERTLAEHNFFAAVKNLHLQGKMLPVVDVSGSMNSTLPGSSITTREAAEALGIAMSSQLDGAFGGLVIAFTDVTQAIYAKKKDSLASYGGLYNMADYTTNILGVFDKIIEIGKQHPSEMPDAIVTFSDGEFDYGDCTKTVYQTARERFTAAGLEMPALILWNLNPSGSRVSNFQMCEPGIFGISGYNAQVLKTMSNINFDNFTNMTYLGYVLDPYLKLVLHCFPETKHTVINFNNEQQWLNVADENARANQEFYQHLGHGFDFSDKSAYYYDEDYDCDNNDDDEYDEYEDECDDDDAYDNPAYDNPCYEDDEEDIQPYYYDDENETYDDLDWSDEDEDEKLIDKRDFRNFRIRPVVNTRKHPSSKDMITLKELKSYEKTGAKRHTPSRRLLSRKIRYSR